MKLANILFAATALVVAPSAAMADTALNSTPTVGWYFGGGNDYSPANTTVSTDGSGNQLFLRWHVNTYAAPTSDSSGTYNFTSNDFTSTGKSLSFDWGVSTVGTLSDITSAVLTVTNLTTNQSVSYDPFAVGNDNSVTAGDNAAENSERLSFGFLFGSDFNINATADYSVSLTVNGLGTDPETLTSDAHVEAVPEPASWAMMIGGFGMIGGVLRRRKAVVSFA